ncbi:MAG: L,D-transpeptidase family protein [Actinomycetota bacterium]|nr:L,D-transpeptidase family protein [Actinomycetota bacterium]
MHRLLVILIALLAVVTPDASAAQPSAPEWFPTQLAHVEGSDQVIVVTAPRWTSTSGTLRAFERSTTGNWVQIVDATPALLGYGGLVLAADRRQGTGKTPAGTFAIESAFGRLANPGTQLPYTEFDRGDAWTYDPKHPNTYNLFQDAAVRWDGYGKYVERLWQYGMQYNYVAVLDFNLPKGPVTVGSNGIRRTAPPADLRRGGGIFLHVSNGDKTAGCLAITEQRMAQIMKWLDPAKKPVIVIGTSATIKQM